MKIVVIGGSGLIWSKLVTKLLEHGHEAVAVSPNSRVNTLTGEGLTEALKSASGDTCGCGIPGILALEPLENQFGPKVSPI